MNRELKFRAWDKEEKVMCPVKVYSVGKGAFLIGNTPTPEQQIDDRSYVSSITEGHFVMMEDLELMQYTGLKDKNGKEIYEGDIVKTYFCGNDPEQSGVIEWFNFAWRLHRLWLLTEIKSIEVIGNIFESPELLTPKP